MIVTLRFKKFGGKPQLVTIELSEELTLAQLKKLWEFEHFLNNLPGVTTRLHLETE